MARTCTKCKQPVVGGHNASTCGRAGGGYAPNGSNPLAVPNAPAQPVAASFTERGDGAQPRTKLDGAPAKGWQLAGTQESIAPNVPPTEPVVEKTPAKIPRHKQLTSSQSSALKSLAHGDGSEKRHLRLKENGHTISSLNALTSRGLATVQDDKYAPGFYAYTITEKGKQVLPAYEN
jgi:hypothetical protein